MQPRDLPHICASLVLVAHIAASTAVRIFETTKVISKRVIPKFQLLRAKFEFETYILMEPA